MLDAAPPAPTVPVPLQQSEVFGRAMTVLGLTVIRRDLRSGSVSALVRRVPGFGRIGLVSRGPARDVGVDAAEWVTDLRGLRASLGLTHLIANPEHAAHMAAMRDAGFVRIARPGLVGMLPIGGEPDRLLARMDGKWRNRLRRAQRGGLVVERHEITPCPDHWLFEWDRAQQLSRNYRSLPHRVIAAIARAEPGAAQLFACRRSGCRGPVAAMLFLRHGEMATYQIGWSSAQGRAASAHNLLLWEAMRAFSSRGVSVLDLGVIDPERTPGIDRFKLGAGAEVQELGGTWIDSVLTAPLRALRR